MIDNVQQLEDLQDEIEEYFSENSGEVYFRSLKRIIIKLAINACDGMNRELQSNLEKALKLWNENASFDGIDKSLIEKNRQNLNKAIKHSGVDSREAWLSRLNNTSLHSGLEDDDTLLTLIFEFSHSNDFSIDNLREMLIAEFPDWKF